ncbi:MAG TPA: hypothetical protein VLI06_00280 [Solimonas sp.]|nr:hypothetical protein [Solimonas sp.]
MSHRLQLISAACLLALSAPAAAAGLDTLFASYAPFAAANPRDAAGQSCIAWEYLGPRLVKAAEPHCAMRGEAGACRDVAYEGRFSNVCPVSMEVTWKWQDHHDSASLWTLAPGESRLVACLKSQDTCNGELQYSWAAR